MAINKDEITRLTNVFNNILDNYKFHEKPGKEFNQDKNCLNVIKNIIPLNTQEANFNNIKYPEELYQVEFLNGDTQELEASDISHHAMETHKHIYLHNNSLTNPIYSKGFIYTRCSRENDISIETQRKICFDYAMKEGIQLYQYGYAYDNNVSARKMNNLNYELGFWTNYLEENSHLIIYSVDRLSRDLLKGLQFLENLTNKNITVHFVTNEIKYSNKISSTHKAMVQSELQNAERFSNQTSEKIKASLQRLRNEGHYLGKAGYGYSVKTIDGIKKKVVNKSEQKNINKICAKYKDICKNKYKYIDNGDINKSTISVFRFLSRWSFREGVRNKTMAFTPTQIKKFVII
jgi:DNA invertase Pin-like site-specific DNA recombinase